MCTNVWATTYTEIGYVRTYAWQHLGYVFQIDLCALWLRAGCAGAASVTLAVHFFPGVVGLLGRTIAPCGPSYAGAWAGQLLVIMLWAS